MSLVFEELTGGDAAACPLCESGRIVHFSKVGDRQYFSCAVCHLVHLAPEQRLPLDAARRIYELHENSPADMRYRAFLDRLARPLASRLPTGACGLDYGCGPGPTLSVMLQEQGFKVQVYDPLFAPDPSVLQRRYQFITCSEAAEHFFSPKKEFDRLDALLEAGGWLGVMTTMLPKRSAFPTWHYARDPTHVSFYSRATMRWIAACYGWAALILRRNVVLFRKNGEMQCNFGVSAAATSRSPKSLSARCAMSTGSTRRATRPAASAPSRKR